MKPPSVGLKVLWELTGYCPNVFAFKSVRLFPPLSRRHNSCFGKAKNVHRSKSSSPPLLGLMPSSSGLPHGLVGPMWAAIEPKRNKSREDGALIRKSLAEIEAFRVSFPLVSQQNLRPTRSCPWTRHQKRPQPQPSRRHPSRGSVTRNHSMILASPPSR
jgi:hypothetical protein